LYNDASPLNPGIRTSVTSTNGDNASTCCGSQLGNVTIATDNHYDPAAATEPGADGPSILSAGSNISTCAATEKATSPNNNQATGGGACRRAAGCPGQANPEDRFYAELNLADGLQKLADSCDYRPLIDARSSKDGADVYAACRRAVDAAHLAYERAAATATALGWTHLVNEMRRFQSRLNLRRLLIDQSAKYDSPNRAAAFHPRSIRDVRVSREFEAGASTLTRQQALATLAEAVVADAKALTGRQDARGTYLLGLIKDIRGAGPEEAARSYAAAAELLSAERGGFFDPRRRRTIIENRGEIMRDLALRLLALHREADAFAAFESVRARGLSELASILARPDVTTNERRALADLLVLESRGGAIEQGIVAEMVANGQLDASIAKLRELDDLRADRRALARAAGRHDARSGETSTLHRGRKKTAANIEFLPLRARGVTSALLLLSPRLCERPLFCRPL
jgi:hypothetical protein